MQNSNQSSAGNFWHDYSRYGVIHYSANNLNKQKLSDSTGKKSVSLLIFVHGLLGDANLTWGKMPGWILKNAGQEMDVISFSYPSKAWHRTSLDQAAYDLKTWIKTEFPDHRHLIFVTHSTGGLVVKQLLNQDYHSNLEHELWGKTRQVINIAVPHFGGSPILTNALNITYQLFYPFLFPWLRLSLFLSQGKKDWGRNSIIPVLRWKNRWLLELDSQFLIFLKQSIDLQQPTPSIVDIYAESDQSVPEFKDQGRQQIRIRGTHKSVKIPKRSNALVVGIVAKIVSQYPQDISLSVVDRTLMRIQAVNLAAGFQSLIGKVTDTENPNDSVPEPTISTGDYGSQEDVCQFVIHRLANHNDIPTRVVLTGGGGVGKSTVMRMITWRLGCQYLTNPDTSPIPLFIPLQQVTATDITDETYTWERLWEWWLHWAHSLFPDEHCTMEWLVNKFENHPVAIILDGLDDFLVNHSSISLSTIVNLLRLAVHTYSSNTQLSIVVAIRNDVYGLDRLADDPTATYEILPLSRQQAIENFPNCKTWVSNVQNPKLLDKILTPLVLNNYKPTSAQFSGSNRITQASILNQIIETFLRNSRLVGRHIKNHEFIELENLLISLSIIAWLFFYKSRGEIHRELLSEEATQLKEQWQVFFTNKGNPRESEGFLSACEIIENADLCTLLLNSDVFISTGPDMYRFTHRHWQELLLGRFFLNCIRYQNFEDFGNVKLYAGIYRMAGDMYQGQAISTEQVQCVIDTWKATGSTCVTANFIGFLAWTITPIDAQAVKLLLDEYKNFKGLSRVILIGGLGYRILVNNPLDRSINDIRRVSFQKFIDYANPDSTAIFAPVATSLAWCYQKAFAQLFDIPDPANPWPELNFEDDLTIKILSMVATIINGKATLTDSSKSLQQAMLTPILDTYQYPEYIIRAVHYLYVLVIAEKHGVHAFSVSQELPALFAAGSNFEKLIADYDLVPEVGELYRRCQQLHFKLETLLI